MGKGSPSNRSVFDFKPGTLQVDRPNDGVLGQPLSPAPAAASPFSTIGSTASSGLSKGGRREAAPLDLTDDGGIDIEINPAPSRPEPDPRSFVGEPAAPSPTPFLQEIGAATPDAPEQGMGGFSSLVRGVVESDAPAQSSGFGKGGTRGGSSLGRFGSRGFSKGARGYSRGGVVDPESQAFTQGFRAGVLEPIVSTPIPNNNDPYVSAGGLTNLLRPPVYQGVNAYNRGIPVGQPTTPAAIQMAQNFANPSIFSYNNPNPQGTMPSGLAGVAQAQQQPGQMPMAGQAPNQIQPYTMGA
tara:strand:+ start:278 stop:1171 length:894 start_codon:yes stop_codon:yes gene_type:complete